MAASIPWTYHALSTWMISWISFEPLQTKFTKKRFLNRLKQMCSRSCSSEGPWLANNWLFILQTFHCTQHVKECCLPFPLLPLSTLLHIPHFEDETTGTSFNVLNDRCCSLVSCNKGICAQNCCFLLAWKNTATAKSNLFKLWLMWDMIKEVFSSENTGKFFITLSPARENLQSSLAQNTWSRGHEVGRARAVAASPAPSASFSPTDACLIFTSGELALRRAAAWNGELLPYPDTCVWSLRSCTEVVSSASECLYCIKIRHLIPSKHTRNAILKFEKCTINWQWFVLTYAPKQTPTQSKFTRTEISILE